MEAIISEWDKIFTDVQAHLDLQDRAMVEAHARCTDLARGIVRYMFAEGDQVLLRA